MTNDDLVNDNINLAYKFAWDYHLRIKNIELEEIQSICFLGLVKAANTYDDKRETKFSTYAYKVMQSELFSFIKQNKKNYNNISLNTETFDGLTLEDCLYSEMDVENDVEKVLYKEKLYEFISELTDIEQTIIKLYMQNLTFEQIGNQLNISSRNANRIYGIAFKKLRYKFFKFEGGEF